jgi:hypothetical protein
LDVLGRNLRGAMLLAALLVAGQAVHQLLLF